MRPRTLVLAATLASLLVAFPTAAAQQQATAAAALAPFERAVRASDHVEANGVLRYTADATANLALGGLPVTYQIVQAPAWAIVRVSPENDVIPTGMNGLAQGASFTWALHFTIVADTLSNASGDVLDEIQVRAIVQPGIPGGNVAIARASIPIHLAQDPHACPTPAAGAGDGASAPSSNAPLAKGDASAPQPATPLHVQSASTSIPTVSYVALAGFGLVGAGVGLFLRRRA